MISALLLTLVLAGCGGQAPGQPAALPEADARLSASLVLSLTGGGARGETQQEFWHALRLADMTPAEIQSGNRALQAVLTQPDPRVEVALANAVWHRPDVEVVDAFVDLAGDFYGATVDEAAFGTQAGTDKSTTGRLSRPGERLRNYWRRPDPTR